MKTLCYYCYHNGPRFNCIDCARRSPQPQGEPPQPTTSPKRVNRDNGRKGQKQESKQDRIARQIKLAHSLGKGGTSV